MPQRRAAVEWLNTATLDMTGALKQIGTIPADAFFIAVGNALCANKAREAWCMPLNGQGDSVKIADVGRVLGAI